MAGIDEGLLDKRLALLETTRGWSPRLISKLESHIRSDDEDALFRINPITFANSRSLEEGEVIDLFLHAATAGLFHLDWLLLCPACSCVVESFRSLSGVTNQYHCNLCQTDYEAALDDLIAVTFTVNPQIRDIALHHPERLSAWDLIFRHNGTRDGQLPDGTAFVDVQQSLTRAAIYLPPGETSNVDVEANDGLLFGASAEGRIAFLYTIEGEPREAIQQLDFVYHDIARKHSLRKIAPGRFRCSIANTTEQRGTCLIAVLPPDFRFGHAPVSFVPFLTGKRVLTSQTFRDLFHAEVIRASDGIGIKDITLLFTDLKGSTALYDRIGDLNAFSLVRQHFDRLQHITVRHNGAIVKTIGDAVMAAFLNPLDAVKAAIAMHDEIARFDEAGAERQIILKIGVHKGAAIAVTLNERLDYFGQTVNIAARVQNIADADELYISEQVFEADGVADELEPLSIETRNATLRGIDVEMRVYRISLPQGDQKMHS